MDVSEKKFTVPKLVDALMSGQLTRNEEYQRGEAWNEVQKASFIDSILRKYPVPPLFFHHLITPGLDDEPGSKYEIVDGQQRLSALRDFTKGKFKLLELGERSKLRVPKGVRSLPAPWGGKAYDELPERLRDAFNETEITAFVIGPQTNRDEVRDLFIRLQAGTALSRQQIRDAWPGNVGPFVESLAGKLNRRPAVQLFSVIDRRGARADDDEQRDAYVADRQMCAQLLHVFIARERDPNVFPSITASELDDLYHEQTDFDTNGPTAQRFRSCLTIASDVFKKARELKVQRGAAKNMKFLRADVSAVMIYLQDVTRDALFKVDRSLTDGLAGRLTAGESSLEKPVSFGKSTSGVAMEKYYRHWLPVVVGEGLGVRLDPRRLFDDAQKAQIYERDQGRCAICEGVVESDDAEYDHDPVPYRLGGRTEVENGRLVHATCHQRGRPLAE